jgi:hypothetical protein
MHHFAESDSWHHIFLNTDISSPSKVGESFMCASMDSLLTAHGNKALSQVTRARLELKKRVNRNRVRCKLLDLARCVLYNKMRHLNIPGVTAALSAFIESNLKLPLT